MAETVSSSDHKALGMRKLEMLTEVDRGDDRA